MNLLLFFVQVFVFVLLFAILPVYTLPLYFSFIFIVALTNLHCVIVIS